MPQYLSLFLWSFVATVFWNFVARSRLEKELLYFAKYYTIHGII